MTLGGLALAIGLLVDNATVTIENIHRNQSLGKALTVAILDGSAEVIQPLTVATLAICIVFFPVVLLVGAGALSVHSAGRHRRARMLASYVLSFTVVPTFARLLLTEHEAIRKCAGNRACSASSSAASSASATAMARALAVRPRAPRASCWSAPALLLVLPAALAFTDRHRTSSPPPMSA